MSKTITSPVKEFPGSVELPDRLTMPQALAFEQSIRDGQALGKELEEDEVKPSQTQYDAVMVGAICTCVEEWELEDFGQLAPDTFPATPRIASAELIAWLYGEIIGMYNPEVPNE